MVTSSLQLQLRTRSYEAPLGQVLPVFPKDRGPSWARGPACLLDWEECFSLKVSSLLVSGVPSLNYNMYVSLRGLQEMIAKEVY